MAETLTTSKFGLGVLAGVEYSNVPDAELTDAEITQLKKLCEKAAKRDYPARLIEVVQAWEAALFYRGFQFLVPQRGGGWIIPSESTGYGPSMQMDLSLLPTNIYSAHAQIVISSLTRSVPFVRFQPQDANNDSQITAAQSAEKFIKVIERNNDLIVVQTDASRYLWTDGRFLYYTRFVKDGQRFGWQEDDEPGNVVPENEPAEAETNIGPVAAEAQASGQETPGQGGEPAKSDTEEEAALEGSLEGRTPRGQEVRTAHGKLEVKLVPMMANSLPECHALQYETEIDVSTARGMFPEKAKDIKGGSNSQTEGQIARLARQNVKLGMQSTYVTSDSVAEDVTIQRSWFRPSALMAIDDEDVRNALIEKFPDGAAVVYAGDVFCYARNESMDECWALGQAYSGDGQNRNALGTSLMPVQKRLNNWLDLLNDFFVRAIPKKWMDNKAFDVEAIRGQTNTPGDVGPFKRQPGTPVSELIFVEPPVPQPVSLAEFVKEYSGPLAELLSGAYPALAGSNIGEGDTATGMAIQRDQALGRLGPTWHSIQNAEAAAMRQAVRWGARCRDQSINEKIPGGETVRLEVNDLKGNILCYPESDENFPESYPQKQHRVMQVFNDSAKNPALQEVLYNAANLQFLQSMIALSDLYIPQVAAYEKQLGEFELLLKGEPVPNPTFVQAKKSLEALKVQGVDSQMYAQAEQQLEQLPKETSSVPVDPLVDDNETEAMGCWQFLNSPEGRKAKHTTPKGYANVRWHFIEHTDAAKQKAAQDVAPPPEKPPSKSMTLRDMRPGERAQLLAQGGIQADQETPPQLPGAPQPSAPVQ